MTATYTLHVAPHADRGDPEALERAILVRDGFSWGAFLVPALWYAGHRHWVAALVALVLVGLTGFGLRAAGLGLGAAVLVQALLHLLHGFEGPSVRRWLYALKGRPAADIVQAGSTEEAELKSIGRWLAIRAERPSYAIPARVPGPVPGAFSRVRDPGIGLFPDEERRA